MFEYAMFRLYVQYVPRQHSTGCESTFGDGRSSQDKTASEIRAKFRFWP